MPNIQRTPIPSEPFEDPHFAPTHRFEGHGSHKQATPQQAAERGWYYRPAWYQKLVPDTRRCFVHGEVMFAPFPLTTAEQDLRHPISPNIMTGKPSDYDAPV